MHMLIEEEPKPHGEITPDAIVDVFEEGDIVEETTTTVDPDERPDEIDIAFQANDEGYW